MVFEFAGHPFLLAENECMLQSDCCLVGRDIQKEPLCHFREVGPLRSRGDDAHLAANAESRRCDVQIGILTGDPGAGRPLMRRRIVQRTGKGGADFTRFLQDFRHRA